MSHHNWTRLERHFLYILHEDYQLENDEVAAIFNAEFATDNHGPWSAPRLRDEYGSRRAQTRSREWVTDIDTPTWDAAETRRRNDARRRILNQAARLGIGLRVRVGFHDRSVRQGFGNNALNGRPASGADAAHAGAVVSTLTANSDSVAVASASTTAGFVDLPGTTPSAQRSNACTDSVATNRMPTSRPFSLGNSILRTRKSVSDLSSLSAPDLPSASTRTPNSESSRLQGFKTFAELLQNHGDQNARQEAASAPNVSGRPDSPEIEGNATDAYAQASGTAVPSNKRVGYPDSYEVDGQIVGRFEFSPGSERLLELDREWRDSYPGARQRISDAMHERTHRKEWTMYAQPEGKGIRAQQDGRDDSVEKSVGSGMSESDEFWRS